MRIIKEISLKRIKEEDTAEELDDEDILISQHSRSILSSGNETSEE